MKKISLSYLIGISILIAFSGCATINEEPLVSTTVEKQQPAIETVQTEINQVEKISEEKISSSGEKDDSHVLQNVKEDDIEEYVEQKGVIFAKTDFQGVLKKKYVKFLFQDQKDINHEFQLLIGDKSPDTVFPWSLKTVEPGYFFVELPVGTYKIASISIPVGSDVATETIDIELTVEGGAITYVGTLKVVGTKDKIKLGGVPVIRPGFEYIAEVIDQREEAFEIFNQRYPKFSGEIKTDLMKIGR